MTDQLDTGDLDRLVALANFVTNQKAVEKHIAQIRAEAEAAQKKIAAAEQAEAAARRAEADAKKAVAELAADRIALQELQQQPNKQMEMLRSKCDGQSDTIASARNKVIRALGRGGNPLQAEPELLPALNELLGITDVHFDASGLGRPEAPEHLTAGATLTRSVPRAADLRR